MESTGCVCKQGYGGTITAKENGYYFNGGYDGSCFPNNQPCGDNVGFSADYDRSVTWGRNWYEVTQFRTEGFPNLYNEGGYFNRISGRFSPPTDGFYLCSTQLRIDNNSGSYTRVTIRINGKDDNNNGMTVMMGDYGDTNYRTQGVSGVLQLKKNDYTSVWVQSGSDNSWNLHGESGFSCHMLKTIVGFHADKSSNQAMPKLWTEVRMMRVRSCACTH